MKKLVVSMIATAFLLPAIAAAAPKGNVVDMKTMKKTGAVKTIGAGVVGQVKGQALKNKGKGLIKKGNANVKKGEATQNEAKVTKGKNQIAKGRKMVQAGKRQKKAGRMASAMGKGMIKSKFQKKAKPTPTDAE